MITGVVCGDFRWDTQKIDTCVQILYIICAKKENQGRCGFKPIVKWWVQFGDTLLGGIWIQYVDLILFDKIFSLLQLV